MTREHKRLLGAFCAGTLAGALALGLVARGGRPPKRDPARMKEHLMRKLSTRLELTPDQRLAVSAAIDRHLKSFEEAEQAERRAHRQRHQAARAEIAALLSEEQKVKYAELNKRWDEKRKRRRRGR